jgi:glycosyltransferase involved in cell wall biosynthesis
VVDDGSDDGSAEIAAAIAADRPLRVIAGPGRGAAAALNVGFRAARFPIICQVDQDVTIRRGWMTHLVKALDDPRVAAAQGRYVIDASAPVGARVMAVDLEQRYAALGTTTDHVCTGNTAYRADAAHAVGLFDETLGYGYDNDLSYRLRNAGHRLAFVRDATSVHHWRDTFASYLRQQYGFGYGRLDVVSKHPSRIGGDRVSRAGMMLHPIGLAIGLGLFVLAAAMSATRGPAIGTAIAAGTIMSGLLGERIVAALLAWRRSRERAALLFPLWHLARDAAWVTAMVVWTARRAFARRPDPSHSMSARPAHHRLRPGDSRVELHSDPPAPTRVIGIIPAHNERAILPSVLGEIHAHHPALDLLVVDDGSTDGTSWMLDELGAAYLRLPDRMGVGSAMRAGLGYAARLGYDAAVRLDGDGQHAPEDVDGLLAPIVGQRADVVLGSRYAIRAGDDRSVVRVVQWLLAAWMSSLTGSAVTDPTSGFYAIGPRAVRLLAEHHPTGYPEPELRLFLSRNGLTAVEVPVATRARLAGRSSLTPTRLLGAAARVLLALVTVPFRRAVVAPRRD